MSNLICFLTCSFVPYFVIFIEFYQIYNSIQGGQNITFMFWSAYLAFVIFAIVIAEIAVIQNYLYLCYELPSWWWRTFIYGASCSFWFYHTITYHLLFELQIEHVTTIIVYMMLQIIVCVCIALTSGTVSVLAAFVFNTLLYKGIKQD